MLGARPAGQRVTDMTISPYRSLPSIDRLLGSPQLMALAPVVGRDRLTEHARGALEAARRAIAEGRPAPETEALVASVAAAAETASKPRLRRVINATGVVIHTNLGRAPVSSEAAQAMATAAEGYSNLEFDLETGERGSRHSLVEGLLTELTGAEAAIAVNNNASALLLGLSAVARGRDVVVSRGEAVEIGGGFRIPDVLAQSGARLVEVGTTNRTYLRDYDDAITHETAAFLRVHSSNFRIIGFTHRAELHELAGLAHRRGLFLLDDLGSGCLLDTTAFGLAREPVVQASIAAGAGLVFFSGDKLLGGPQAGIIAGRMDLIERIKRHPLARAVRLDKASLAGLSVTLLHYLRGEALERVPVWQMISAPMERLDQRAASWSSALPVPSHVTDGRSMIGGGSLPEEGLPTRLLALTEDDLPEGLTPQVVAGRLRTGSPPVVARIERGTLLLDPRTVLPGEDAQVLDALLSVLSTAKTDGKG